MNRLLGFRKTAPQPTPTSETPYVPTTVEELDVEIAKIKPILSGYYQTLKERPAGTNLAMVRGQANMLLARHNAYESQKQEIEQSKWIVERQVIQLNSTKNNAATMVAVKKMNKEMEKQQRNINIDEIERLQDRRAELMEVANEIQESMSRGYYEIEEINDEELDAQLEALGYGIDFELDTIEEHEVSEFLNESGPPEFIDEAPQAAAKQTAT